MAADPKVKFATSTQGFNRFSYTDNNPLSRLDMNGYGWLSKQWKKHKQTIITIAVVALAAYTGGAAYGAFMTSQAGAGMAIAGYSGSLIMATAGAVAGAASGAVIGAASGYAATGNLRGAIKGAAGGGITGAAGGGIGGYFGNSATTGRMLNGGLNGAMQTGTTEGFARGMVAGAIPTDLGISAYNTNAYANFGIGVLRDGIKGGIINGREGAEYMILDQLKLNAFGHGVGLITSGFSSPTLVNGAYVYEGSFWNTRGAITFGNVISGPSGLSNYPNSWLFRHEYGHVAQGRMLGFDNYFLAHGLSMGAAMLVNGDHHGPVNIFENSYNSTPHDRSNPIMFL